jgi:hypothetical protein
MRVTWRVVAATCFALTVAGCGDDASPRDGRTPARGVSRAAKDAKPRDETSGDEAARSPRDDDAESIRLRRRVDDLERRVAQLERARAGDGPRPDAPPDDVDRPAIAKKAVDPEETERLRERILGGSASPEEARQFWKNLDDEADADNPDLATARRMMEAAAPRDLPRAIHEDIRLPLDEADARWKNVKPVVDGARGGAASFGDAGSLIDVGPCPVTSTEPFTLHAFIRTREAGFSTALIARDGDDVGFAIVMGRDPGHVTFEAWSWSTVRLKSTHRVDDGAWHEIEATYDPKTRGAILSVDSVRQDAAVVGGPAFAVPAMLRLGNNIGAEQPFKGDLDEVYVLRRTAHPEAFGK